MFELDEVTSPRQEAKNGEQPIAAQGDADGTPVADGPCDPEAGNCGPTATCGPAHP